MTSAQSNFKLFVFHSLGKKHFNVYFYTKKAFAAKKQQIFPLVS